MDRKSFIELNIKAGIGFCALQTASGCALFDEPEMRVCSVAELEENPYLISRFNRKNPGHCFRWRNRHFQSYLQT
ncbi:MAG: hypothetical protein R3B93_08340 [Bacteroidia bacterium]